MLFNDNLLFSAQKAWSVGPPGLSTLREIPVIFLRREKGFSLDQPAQKLRSVIEDLSQILL